MRDFSTMNIITGGVLCGTFTGILHLAVKAGTLLTLISSSFNQNAGADLSAAGIDAHSSFCDVSSADKQQALQIKALMN